MRIGLSALLFNLDEALEICSNIDEINSYYCSFQECGIDFEGTHTDENNNFLYLLGMLIKKDLMILLMK